MAIKEVRPQSPDPYIREDADMTLARFGHLNYAIRYIQALEDANTAALALKAPLASPVFTGTPSLPTGTTVVTQSPGNSTTAPASTAFVAAAITAETADVAAGLWRTVATASSSHTAAQGAATYVIGTNGGAAVASGGNSAVAVDVVRIDPADYPTLGGLVAKFRLQVTVVTNFTAPTGTYTFALNTSAVTGGAGNVVHIAGAALSGSTTATLTTPTASGKHTVVTATDFDLPVSATDYIFTMTTTGTVAASAHMHVVATLMVHYG